MITLTFWTGVTCGAAAGAITGAIVTLLAVAWLTAPAASLPGAGLRYNGASARTRPARTPTDGDAGW